MTEGRIMAIDYGLSRVGLALSDPTQTLASSLKTVKNGANEVRRERCLAEVADAAADNDVSLVVIGLPLRTDGKPGNMASAVEAFAADLRNRLDIPVVLFDERYTTKIASRYLTEIGISAKKQRAIIDERSAELLLQDYLERQRGEMTP
jgi:putative Holliday junction resolvase